MFNVKALWWTILAVWIFGSTYWHVCKIRQLCDAFYSSRLFLTEIIPSSGEADISGNLSIVSDHNLGINEIWQYIIMLGLAILLGFLTGKSYESRRTRELRYKLNRINRELKFYQSKS